MPLPLGNKSDVDFGVGVSDDSDLGAGAGVGAGVGVGVDIGDHPSSPLPLLNSSGHVAHCGRCLDGLPSSLVEMDASRMAIAFYCLGTLDVTNYAERKISSTDRESWKEWIWDQYVGERGGFRPGPFMGSGDSAELLSETEATTTSTAPPHLIMTYCALLALATLRDDYAKLDRAALARMVGACQDADGGFATMPGGGDADLRMTYCAFVVCALLDDWSCIDLAHALKYIQRCRTYEGGYGQTPQGESLGGPTYCALAALHLVPPDHPYAPAARLQPAERHATVRWLVYMQAEATGGFSGRTNKLADACYGFWCGAALAILGAGDFLDARALGRYLAQCQYKFGGISKAPGEHPDPYHTYLSIAAAAIVSPDPGWELQALDPIINATHERRDGQRRMYLLRR
ncbi:terpenoid cyclases/Protein prenyltransferase [Multifurca ochricompacta]|uniref:Terpenoid cyclases/Protein prenyltransferase n=1 Tax=Multifurca ochricompacta TaxID=376703 RepID=A0AAD4M0W8_9AGAM|nr:terpenoid cyclases/Protein prenyltransferase [Multifurca ochricompacta]